MIRFNCVIFAITPLRHTFKWKYNLEYSVWQKKKNTSSRCVFSLKELLITFFAKLLLGYKWYIFFSGKSLRWNAELKSDHRYNKFILTEEELTSRHRDDHFILIKTSSSQTNLMTKLSKKKTVEKADFSRNFSDRHFLQREILIHISG